MSEITLNFSAQEINERLAKVTAIEKQIEDTAKSIPGKTSQLTNDSGYIGKDTNALTNYYLKSQTYTRGEVDNKLSSIPKFSIEVVGSLPTSNVSRTTVYLVPMAGESNDMYKEYIYVNEEWELLGTQTISGSDELNPVPDYASIEAERLSKQVLSHQNSNTFTFLAISDSHYLASNANIVNGIVHAGQALDIIRKSTHIDFAVNLGDNSWGSSISGSQTTIEEGIEEIRSVNKKIDAGFKGIPNFRTPGNHDNLAYNYTFNGNDYLDSDELFPLFGAYNSGAVFPDGEKDRGYCYRDFEEFKLRVVTMNTCDLKDLDPANKESMYTSGTQMK